MRGGEITAIIGPNGAGKTTLLNAAMGALPISGGRVVLAGEDITRMTMLERVRRGLALCPKGRQVFPRMTVAENLRMGGYTLARRESELRMEEMLEEFPRLKSRLKQQAGTLGGEQQWLAIARFVDKAAPCCSCDGRADAGTCAGRGGGQPFCCSHA